MTTEKTEGKVIEIDATHVIAWANQAKKGLPKKLYVGDTVVDFDKINTEKLETLQEDSKYIFFCLTLNADGTIDPKPPVPEPVPGVETPAEPAKTEEPVTEAVA